MSWNRDLTQFEAQTLSNLHLKGYKAVDKKHMIHFKEIYDFICRFADPAYSGKVRVHMTSGSVPPKTRAIINDIGPENLFQYFSTNAFPEYFYTFCEKLIRTRRIRSVDYIAEGTIIASPIIVEESSFIEVQNDNQ